ncbi:uncharacterized protein LOC142775875 isoform X4 [Rhipicephalus microplus]|uniref:uncharacterized protein LOC142775875 isoform X4 n=1 Tax=Rhipicephalus microplus TaxID=6941 RepID=UPI003F6CAFD1
MEFTATTAWAPRWRRRRETFIGGENQRVSLLYGTLLAVPRCDSLRGLGWQLARGGWLNTRFRTRHNQGRSSSLHHCRRGWFQRGGVIDPAGGDTEEARSCKPA